MMRWLVLVLLLLLGVGIAIFFVMNESPVAPWSTPSTPPSPSVGAAAAASVEGPGKKDLKPSLSLDTLSEPPKEQSVEAFDSKTMGAIQVNVANKDPVDSFDVLRDGKRAFQGDPKLLNSTLELAPGTYVVDVNRTQRTVTIEPGKETVLWTGELVEGNPSTMAWYAMLGDTKLTSSGVEPLLNKVIALFPGTYKVFVDTSLTGPDKNLGDSKVEAGRKTVCHH